MQPVRIRKSILLREIERVNIIWREEITKQEGRKHFKVNWKEKIRIKLKESKGPPSGRK